MTEAVRQAEEVLRRCSHELGLKASADAEGYPQVWARDSMITLLGAALLDDDVVIRACLSSVRTLAEHQTARGLIPNNVDVRTGRPNFQAYADGGLWFCIGASHLCRILDDDALTEELLPAVRRTLEWYAYQDVHDEGLVVIEEGSDWMDLFAVRGRGLYVNCLRVLALRAAARLEERLGRDSAYREDAEEVCEAVRNAFWYPGDDNVYRFVRRSFGTDEIDAEGFSSKGYRIPVEETEILADHAYFIPYFTFRRYGEWFDTLGNLLAILAGVATDEQAMEILSFAEEHRLSGNGPIRAIWPALQPESRDWRPYFTFDDLNLPDQYHNGGIWPFIGGFYVAALISQGQQERARQQLDRLSAVNARGGWRFSEWLDGKTGEPAGVPYQAWSAGMYVYARACVEDTGLSL